MGQEGRELDDSLRLVAIGRVAKGQGRRGEVAVEPLTDFPDRFERLERVFVTGEGGRPVAYRLEGVRMHKGRPVVKLTGVSSIGEAEALRDKELSIPEEEVLPLPEGSFYLFQIEGLRVEDEAAGDIGVVASVLETGGCDLLVVRRPDGEETLVPLCEEIVRSVDTRTGRIVIDAPEGLVSLNAN